MKNLNYPEREKTKFYGNAVPAFPISNGVKKSIIAFIAGALLLLPLAFGADNISVSASFNASSVQVGEELHLTIHVEGPSMNIQAPRLPSLPNFDTYYTGRASHMSYVNGVSSNSVEFSYTLIPKQAGRFTLPSIEIQAGSQTLRTSPLSVDVVAGSSQPRAPVSSQTTSYRASTLPPATQSSQPEPVLSNVSDDNIFVQAWVDRKTVYQNEQLLLSYSLYTRYDTRYEGFEKEPETSGFWIEDFPMEREISRETVRVNGKRYVKADVKKVALFPTAPGDYTIQPGSIKVSIREEPQGSNVFDEFFSDSFFTGGSFFARRQNRLLNPPPIKVVVKPLPEEGKPAGFQGAVGQYRISASIDRDKVKQNEPVTLKLTIEGEGNAETLTQPKLPELTGFKVYEADTNFQLFRTGDVIGGTKTFEIVFIPKNEGKAFIPLLEFSYFDPRKEKYITLHTPNFPITVEHSDESFKMPDNLSAANLFKKQVTLESKDIRFIAEKIPDPFPGKIFGAFYRGLQILNAVFLFALFGLWFKSREETIFSKDEALRRRKFARSGADVNLRMLKKLAHSSGTEKTMEFFVELEKALTQYISDKWNLSTYGVTRRDLEEELAGHLGADDPLLKEVVELYNLCDESRFGKGSIPQASKKVGLKIFQDTVNRIERIRS